MTVDEFTGNDDYALRWPAGIFADELRRLVNRARPADPEWAGEVELLLEQAFVSAVPRDEFRRILTTTPRPPSDDDVPF